MWDCRLSAFVTPIMGGTLLLATAGPAGAWDLGGPLYQRGPANSPPASYFGYNLDDPHPGYFGGGRYREYYSYGRGYGLANFPGPLPDYRYGYGPRPLVAYPMPVLPVMPVGPPQPAYLDVAVPADAELWIDDGSTRQTGPSRAFVTPPLHPGSEFTYQVRARWTDAGGTVDQVRPVAVRAGERVPVEFRGRASLSTER
jgi:uncharacterized protein (TIGR03000 family)